MPYVRKLSVKFAGFLLLMSYALSLSAAEVIVNNSVTDTEISLSELRAIYMMRHRYWEGNKRIRVFVLPDNEALHRDFSKNQLGIFPHQLRRTWDRQVFSGTGQAPDVVDSEQEMLEMIERTPNSIGYINSKPESESIHVLEIK